MGRQAVRVGRSSAQESACQRAGGTSQESPHPRGHISQAEGGHLGGDGAPGVLEWPPLARFPSCCSGARCLKPKPPSPPHDGALVEAGAHNGEIEGTLQPHDTLGWPKAAVAKLPLAALILGEQAG